MWFNSSACAGPRQVVRAAKQAGCSVLLSEDFQEVLEIDGVRIVNPSGKRS